LTTRALDSSVLVAAFAEWHESHDVARRACRQRVHPVAHALAESYSVLTRLPEPNRASPSFVAAFLQQKMFGDPLLLDLASTKSLPSRLAELGISGGPTYDAVIALTAAAHNAVLVSLDQRAVLTYRRCGVRYELLGT
jgi:predicted nucleic acid-binding protein